MKSELKCRAELCEYINGVQIWARAIGSCKERMIVAVEMNGLPVGAAQRMSNSAVNELYTKWCRNFKTRNVYTRLHFKNKMMGIANQ